LEHILIDGFIVCLVVGIITTIAVAMDVYAIAVVGYILGYGYYFVREQALGGQSVGHKVMGYKVVKEDGSSIKGDFLASFLRNITLLLPFVEQIMVLLDKPRLGDNIAKTRVVPA
jgi:uncharacterized RDD family membrane protein YckC